MFNKISTAVLALVLTAQLVVSAVKPVTVLSTQFDTQIRSEQGESLSASQLRRMHGAEHWMIIENGDGQKWGCTGYAIGKHAILTAQHCDGDNLKVTLDDNQQVNVLQKEYDGADHVIWMVDGPEMKDTVAAEVNHAKAPVQGEHVISWGNPTGVEDQYREGYVAGLIPHVPTPAQQDGTQDQKVIPTLYVFDMAGNHGDSGSAIFDANDGHIVALCTYGLGDVAPTFMGGYALQFSKTQLKQAEHFKQIKAKK